MGLYYTMSKGLDLGRVPGAVPLCNQERLEPHREMQFQCFEGTYLDLDALQSLKDNSAKADPVFSVGIIPSDFERSICSPGFLEAEQSQVKQAFEACLLKLKQEALNQYLRENCHGKAMCILKDLH